MGRHSLLTLVFLLAAPTGAVEHAVVDGEHVLSTPVMKVVVDTDMRLRLISIDGEDEARIVTSRADDVSARPSHYVRVGSADYTLFPLVPGGVTVEPVADHFGSGLGLTLRGQAPVLGVPIEKTLTLRVYDDHPDAVVMQAAFANGSADTPLQIATLVSGHLRLDRRLSNPAEAPWSFTSVQATTREWRDWWLDVPLSPGFSRANDLVSPDAEGRGGQPFIDVRGAETGVALMSLEPGPRAIGLPCRVLGDGRVAVSIVQPTAGSHGQFPESLEPGESVSTILTAAVAHRGDYFDAARRYGLMLQAVLEDAGLKTFGPWPDRVYEPYWKSWGFGLDFTLDDVVGVLDGLADLGITWIALDDGWFDLYGSWRPNTAPGKFPAGEPDLVDFVSSVHTAQWGVANERFDIHTWWYPIAWESGCGIPISYLVRDADGTYPLTDRSHRFLCPAYPPAREEIVGTAVRFLDTYGFDGIYLDGSTLRSVPPCYNAVHAHARPIDAVEAVPELYRGIYETVQALAPDAPLILCECSGPHDPYKMPYAHLEDASDPFTDVDVRKKVKFSKALRGPGAPVGDGYLDPIDYNDLSGTFANSVGVGAVLTTMYTSPHDLGLDRWQTWLGRLRGYDMARGEVLNLYDVAYDRPEAHAIALESGARIYTFFRDDGETMTTVEIRGLPSGEPWRIVDVEAAGEVGTVIGPSGTVPVTWHRQAPGMPEWVMLLATPPGMLDAGPSDSPPVDVASRILVTAESTGLRFVAAGRSHDSEIVFRIHDARGRLVRVLPATRDGALWDRRDRAGLDVAAGVYFVRAGDAASRAFVVLR